MKTNTTLQNAKVSDILRKKYPITDPREHSLKFTYNRHTKHFKAVYTVYPKWIRRMFFVEADGTPAPHIQIIRPLTRVVLFDDHVTNVYQTLEAEKILKEIGYD